MQRRQLLGIGGVHIGAGGQQPRTEFRQAKRGGQHQHGHFPRQALFQARTLFKQTGDYLGVTHAHRSRKRRGPGAGGQLQIGAALQQQLHHELMTAAGRAQQRRAALRVHHIHVEAQHQQAPHGVGIAGHGGGGQVFRLQRATRQRPATPVQPVGDIAPSAGQRHAQRGLAIGRTHAGVGAVAHQRAQRGFAPQRGAQMQGGHAATISRIQVDAGQHQRFQQPHPAQPHHQRQRRITFCRSGKWIGAALQQFQPQLLKPTRAMIAPHAGREEARQPTGTGRRHVMTQQRAQRLDRTRPPGQQGEHGRITQRALAVGALAHIGVRAMRHQPVDPFRSDRNLIVQQQSAELVRGQQRHQFVQPIQFRFAQAIAQQRQRRAVRHLVLTVLGAHA